MAKKHKIYMNMYILFLILLIFNSFHLFIKLFSGTYANVNKNFIYNKNVKSYIYYRPYIILVVFYTDFRVYFKNWIGILNVF